MWLEDTLPGVPAGFFLTAKRGGAAMAKRIRTAQEASQAFVAGMAGAGARYTAGTAAVVSSPMAAAAAKADKALANYTASLSSGDWAAALNAVPISTWKSQCAAAASRLASGAQKGQQKYMAAIQQLQPTYQQMQAASAQAGDDPIAKVSAALAVLMAAGKKGRARMGG